MGSRRMRPKPHSIVVPAVIASAAVLLATAWMLGGEPPPLGVCRLPDGTILRLDAITLGPEHHRKTSLARREGSHANSLAVEELARRRANRPTVRRHEAQRGGS